MKIIIDVDDVLADTFGAIEDHFGKAADVTGENLKLYFPNSNVASIIYTVEFNAAIQPLAGAVGGVQSLLNAGHTAHYLSSRPPSLEQTTREWLRLWGFPEVPVQCLGRENKIESLRTESYDLLIDDMISFLKIARENGKRAIAFANPWNVGWNDLKVAGWAEVQDVLQAVDE